MQDKGELLSVRPIGRDEANDLVARWHRHHKPVQGYKFAVALYQGDELVGAAIAGRPVARHNDDGLTLEVTRVVVRDGIKNGCSKLYGAIRRAGFALGYRRVLTYTLKSEEGKSLVASGWVEIGETDNDKGWSRPSRPRTDKHPVGQKRIWEAVPG